MNINIIEIKMWRISTKLFYKNKTKFMTLFPLIHFYPNKLYGNSVFQIKKKFIFTHLCTFVVAIVCKRWKRSNLIMEIILKFKNQKKKLTFFFYQNKEERKIVLGRREEWLSLSLWICFNRTLPSPFNPPSPDKSSKLRLSY